MTKMGYNLTRQRFFVCFAIQQNEERRLGKWSRAPSKEENNVVRKSGSGAEQPVEIPNNE